jgi:hypothetical protein
MPREDIVSLLQRKRQRQFLSHRVLKKAREFFGAYRSTPETEVSADRRDDSANGRSNCIAK